MPDPTLKDILNAIAQVRAEMATKKELGALEAKVDKRFDKVDKAIAALDADLDGHMDVHRVIEKEVATLKTKIRPTRSAPRAPRRR